MFALRAGLRATFATSAMRPAGLANPALQEAVGKIKNGEAEYAYLQQTRARLHELHTLDGVGRNDTDDSQADKHQRTANHVGLSIPGMEK